MQFGLFYNMDTLPDLDTAQLYVEVLEQITAGEVFGYHTAWMAEHHFAVYGKVPSPLLFLMRAAGQTSHIRLGTAVLELPFYHPLRIAEDVAMADLLSNGRLAIGAGSGTRNKPVEFANFGLSLEEKGNRLLEMIELLETALRDDPFDFHGETYHYSNVRISPRPLQSPHDMIWVAGSFSTAGWAGRKGYKLLMPRVIKPEQEAALLTNYTNEYRSFWPGQPEIGVLRFVYVAPTLEQARLETARAVRRYSSYDAGNDSLPAFDAPSYEAILNKINFIVGDPDYVVRRIEQLRTWTGCTQLICQMYAAGVSHAQALASMQLFSETVMPAF